MDQTQNAYYPSRERTGELHDDFRILFDHIYTLHKQVADAHSEIKKMRNPAGGSSGVAGGASTTKVAGFYVAATPPNDQDRLTYDSATQQVIWKP